MSREVDISYGEGESADELGDAIALIGEIEAAMTSLIDASIAALSSTGQAFDRTDRRVARIFLQ